jgi:uncharacterized protein
MKNAALIVFAKVPVAGEVKTRLTPAFDAGQAARLYEAFVTDSLAQYVRLDTAVRLYLASSEGEFTDDVIPEGVTVHRQSGDGLGERMQRAIIETFAAGYERAVVIGTDHPSLPTEFIRMAFDALLEPISVCIGPTEDGGYYLIGMNDFFPDLFTGMVYSRTDVFSNTLARIETTRANVTILPVWYDVDTLDDLKRLAADLRDSSIEARRTRDVLQEFDLFIPPTPR